MKLKATAFAAWLAVIILFIGCAKAPQVPPTPEIGDEIVDWQQQFDLGMQYLLEGKYEEAIIEFLAVIEIEPRRVEVYEKLAEAYIVAGDLDAAIAALQQGFAATGDDSLQTRANELVSAAPFNALANRIIDTQENRGVAAVVDEMRSENFVKLIGAIIETNSGEPPIYRRADGYGCGFYYIDGELHIYIGQYDGKIRSGEGMWVYANAEDNGYQVFNGIWAQDVPNGEGSIYQAFDFSETESNAEDLMVLELLMDPTVDSTTESTYVNGLMSGATNIKVFSESGAVHNFDFITTGGEFPLANMDDRLAAICTECGCYLMYVEGKYGVHGFEPGAAAVPLLAVAPTAEDRLRQKLVDNMWQNNGVTLGGIVHYTFHSDGSVEAGTNLGFVAGTYTLTGDILALKMSDQSSNTFRYDYDSEIFLQADGEVIHMTGEPYCLFITDWIYEPPTWPDEYDATPSVTPSATPPDTSSNNFVEIRLNRCNDCGHTMRYEYTQEEYDERERTILSVVDWCPLCGGSLAWYYEKLDSKPDLVGEWYGVE